MGEYADWNIDDTMDANPDWSPFGGRSRFEKADDITCDHCGEDGLHWVSHGADGWKLHEPNGARHICKRVADADDFDDLSEAVEHAHETPCRKDGRCQYAIDCGAEQEGRCHGKCLMPLNDADGGDML
jgi:hypothetical protein